jgi:hypothetical protein
VESCCFRSLRYAAVVAALLLQVRVLADTDVDRIHDERSPSASNARQNQRTRPSGHHPYGDPSPTFSNPDLGLTTRKKALHGSGPSLNSRSWTQEATIAFMGQWSGQREEHTICAPISLASQRLS